MSFSLFLLIISFFVGVFSAPLHDLVSHLPDYGSVAHFSGYLNATPGCDEINGECHIHYWMAMGPSKDSPLVLWLNGGPGSSSVIGFVQENGPILMNATGGLMDNPWSWTKVAHMLILESPLGVGYSYCSRQERGEGPCENTDQTTATTNRAALEDFFLKFPELTSNPFFITGESYAGVYIPTLAREILHNAPEINLVGVAVGDPCTDNEAQALSRNKVWYANKYGLMDESVYDLLWNHCPGLEQAVTREEAEHASSHQELAQLWLQRLQEMQPSTDCILALRKFYLSSSNAIAQKWPDRFIDDYSLFSPLSNKEMDDMAAYMQREDVKKVLHVEKSPSSIEWPSRAGFKYTKQSDACNRFPDDDSESMISVYAEIAPLLKVTWVYNGDTDPCVSYEGTRTAIKRVGFEEIDGGGYRPWFYHHGATNMTTLASKAPRFGPNLVAQDVGPQLGGYVVDYSHGLSFLTFHGSGHMVPQFRPQAALQMLRKIVSFEVMSPFMPNNETLLAMDMDNYTQALEDWTEKAKTWHVYQ